MSAAELPALIELRAQLHRGFDGGLRVELGRVADFEEHVLHHVGAVRPLEFELLPAKRNVVEAPGFCGERGGVAHLAGAGHQRQPNGAAGGVARGPAFARAGVGRVAIGAQALAIDPRERERVDGLLAREAEQLADDGGGGDLDQHDVIEADLVEGVFKRDAALNLVGLDHGRQHVAHGQRRLACGDRGAREPVGVGQNAAEIVGRMAPLGGEPGVVEVEPANHGADIEGGLHGIELKVGAGNARAVGNDRCRARWGRAAWCRPDIRALQGRSPACR